MNDATIPAISRRADEPQCFTLGSSSHETVLPIELLSFSASCDGFKAELSWTTATERNNDYFVIEHSNNAIDFEEIARVSGAGNSIEPIDYRYTDYYGVRRGDNYYRLVQVDYDGTRTISEIIVADCNEEAGEPDVQVYPNPFSDILNLHFFNFGDKNATVEIYDVLGKLVSSRKVYCTFNDYDVVMQMGDCSAGTYNVRVSTSDFVIVRQVVKR